MTMDQDFLGAGWAYDLTDSTTGAGVYTDLGGQVAQTSGEDNVRQSIWIILGTAIGERVQRPDFGCGIHDLLFAPLSPVTMGAATAAVRQALELWEPRIEVLDVEGSLDPDEPCGLIIEVHYRSRTTNSRYNLVYPFFLSAGAEPR